MNDPLQQLVDYIKHHLQAGASEDSIRQTLQDANWHGDYIEQGLSSAKSQLQPEQPAQQPIAHPEVQNQHPTSEPTQPTNTSHPQKYTVFRSIADSAAAIKFNFVSFSLSAVIALVVSIIGLTLAFGFYNVVLSELGSVADSGRIFGPVFALMTVVILILNAAVIAFLVTVTSIGFDIGAKREKAKTGFILFQARKSLWRVVRAQIILSLIASIPFILLLGIAYVYIDFNPQLGWSALGLVILCMLIGGIWAVLVYLRYALLPYIALFEQDTPVRKLPKRSYYLVRKGGMWFIIKGGILVLIVVFLISSISGEAVSEIDNSNNPIVLFLMAVISLFINGALTMLYRNRAAVRGSEVTS